MKQKDNSILQTSLEAIGLSKKETKIYLALVKFGTLTLSMLGRHAGLKRGIVYDLTKKLMAMKIVSLYEKDKKLVAQAQPPENLRLLVENKETEAKLAKEQLEHNIIELKNLYENTNIKPNIRYLIGPEAIEFSHKDTLNLDNNDTLYIMVSPYHRQDIWRETLNRVIKKQIKKKINTEVITTPFDMGVKYISKRDKSALVSRKWIPKDEYDASVNIQIYGKKIAFINYRKNKLMGLIIEDQDIAESMRQMFIALKKRIK